MVNVMASTPPETPRRPWVAPLGLRQFRQAPSTPPASGWPRSWPVNGELPRSRSRGFHRPDAGSGDHRQEWKRKGGEVDFYDDGTVVYTRSDGATLPYRNDHPVFAEGRKANGQPMVREQVEIEQAGNHTTGYGDANRAAGDPPCKPTQQGHPEGTVWHHHEDGKTMQLIDQEDHNVRDGGFPHQGGVSQSKK